MAKAKTMNRSRNQLATSYAPQSFFTFEGGIGACISHSTPGEPIELAEATKDQIFERINELGQAWFDAAIGARENDATKAAVLPRQCVDRRLLNNTLSGFQAPGQDRIYLCKPSKMEYTPAPLTFVCRNCKRFHSFESLKELDGAISRISSTSCKKSPHGGPCDFEQLDVIFVHWSGNWSPAFPGQWQWSNVENKVVKRMDACVCGSHNVQLNNNKPGIGEWFFECAEPVCGKPISNKWLQNDPDTLEILGPLGLPDLYHHARMQATPYRASSAYYVHSDLFIDFKDGGHDLLTRLLPGRVNELGDFISTKYGIGITEITNEDVIAACTGRDDCVKDLASFVSAINSIDEAEKILSGLPESMRPTIQSLLQQAYDKRKFILDDLRRRSILVPKVVLPSGIAASIRQRQFLFASKYDPFRLAIEHATLEATRLAVEKRVNGKKPYVSVVNLDEDLGPEKQSDTEGLQHEAKHLLEQLGIMDMGLIREFDLCKFSFGYSRMESVPVLRDKRGQDMPVRLNLFPPIRHQNTTKNPIYVVQQGNEAFYVKLKPEVVMEWLQGLHCADMFTLSGEEKVGAGLLNCAVSMGPYLNKLPESTNPPSYLYLYTLLHSFSHLLMKHISEYSGLDLGTMGEYIFPADLAFVVYRNGTTMDLGNMSAMWRNAGISMLSSMLTPKATQCGTGSLCTHRGGACPDCMMVPETSCIAGNKLLSRTVLRTVGGRPRFDKRESSISGYIDVAQELLCHSAS